MASRKLDINKATVQDFSQLSGIGSTKAEAIISLRNKLGRFTSVGDLQNVSGIGQGLISLHRSILTCSQRRSQKQQKNVKASQRVTRSSANDLKSAEDKSVAASAAASKTCTLDAVAVSGGRRYCTRSRNLETASELTSTFSKARSRTCRKPSKPANNATKPISVSSKDQEPIADGLSVDLVEARPCCSRVEDSNASSANADSVSSESRVCHDLVLPSCSKTMHVFQNARGFDGKLASRRAASSTNAIDCSNIARPCSRLEDDRRVGESAVNELAADESTLNSNAQEVTNDNSSISAQCRVPVSCEILSKHQAKRKFESTEDGTGTKRPCFGDEYISDLQEELTDERQINNALEIHPLSKRKQKIPSKKNPPPLLVGWLKTFQNWTHAERLLALDELMETCNPTEVRHVMQVIEPQFQRDFISLLPKELALYVLSFLEPTDLLRAAQTCRYWHMLAEDNILWREKCHEEGISECLVFGSIARRRRIASKSPWKSLYLRQQQIEHNWRTSSRPPKVLKGHDDHVITCLEFNGTKIVSGSDDNTLKVWSAITGKCLRTLTGHTGGVWSSQMSGNIIVSGSTDRTLKVWDAESGRTIYTLYGHTSTVRCMHLYNNKVVSGSRDATLRMWDIETGHCLHVLIGHMAAVRCVQYDGRRVVSGAYDYMVKIWDPEKETCLQTLTGHTNRVYSLQFDGMHIVSGSLDTSIRVWSVETGACLHTLVGHQSLTSGMELKDNILVSGNADSTVKVWNIMTGQCLQTLSGPNKHQSAVTCLQFNRKLIITSSDDGTIKIWDLKTGEFIRNLVTLESGGSGGVVWRIRCNNSKLVCAVGSRNGTEETKLLVLDFDVEDESTTNRVALTAS